MSKPSTQCYINKSIMTLALKEYSLFKKYTCLLPYWELDEKIDINFISVHSVSREIRPRCVYLSTKERKQEGNASGTETQTLEGRRAENECCCSFHGHFDTFFQGDTWSLLESIVTNIIQADHRHYYWKKSKLQHFYSQLSILEEGQYQKDTFGVEYHFKTEVRWWSCVMETIHALKPEVSLKG